MVRIKTYGLKKVTDKTTRREVLRRVSLLKRRIVPYLDQVLCHDTTPRIIIDEDLNPSLVGNIPENLIQKILESD